MTEISFHFNAPDRLAYACRLLRKAVSRGAKLVVTGQSDTLQQLDAALWTLSPMDFVPHCFVENEPHVVAASAVILALSTESVPHRHVLVNLGSAVPKGFEHFDRLIEVVDLNDEDRQLARARWKHYAERGYTITRHDLAVQGAH